MVGWYWWGMMAVTQDAGAHFSLKRRLVRAIADGYCVALESIPGAPSTRPHGAGLDIYKTYETPADDAGPSHGSIF